MPRSRFVCTALTSLLLLAATAPAQEAPVEGRSFTFDAVLGGQLVSGGDERGRARFEEHREVPEGAVLEEARLAFRPKGGSFELRLTARDAAQDDQRYLLEAKLPGRLSFEASYHELPRLYSTGSKTLWSGVGSGRLTIDEAIRQGAESAAGAPTAPFASGALKAYMDAALAAVSPFDLGTKRKDLSGNLQLTLAPGLTFQVTGSREKKDGTKPLGFGTYIRRQALSGTPGTGAGSFWRETVEARGSELVEPVAYRTTEIGATLSWAGSGHSASAGWFASRFRNDISSLYFDNPFEAGPGRASATIFDPRSDQEPGSPNGNNNLRGLYARSAIQLWPDNDYDRFFGSASVKIASGTRLNATLARATLRQNDAFMPYAENDQVVFSGAAGQPGVVYAKDAPLPRASLDGKMTTTQADVRLSSRLTDAFSARASYRYYDLDDRRPEIHFPGFSSSGDSYFRPGVGQRDAAGNRILYNEVGGYRRQRLDVGAAYRLGAVTLDGEYARTSWDYDARQVDGTTDDAFRGTVRLAVGDANVNAYYQRSSRSPEGPFAVGLETSGVRAYDVWTRERDQLGADVELSAGERFVLGLGGSYWKDEYPGAVSGFAYGYGLQDSDAGSVFATATYSKDDLVLSVRAGYDRYAWNSMQVTKTSLGADYNPVNRWARASEDDVYWVGLEAVVPFGKKVLLRADLDYQRFDGEWRTTNLQTPDVNSAVAYAFPKLSDSVLSARASFAYDVTESVGVEVRYLYEPYRVNDFTIDGLQPYMQGVLKETRSSPSDLGDMNVSRFLFLDSRYTSYTAHVLSVLAHLRF